MSTDDQQPVDATTDEGDEEQADVETAHRRAQQSGEVFEGHQHDGR